jgi:transmembrane sensor
MTNEPRNMQSGSGHPDWDALARYQAGECTAEEAATIQAWLEAHPADAQLLSVLDGALQRLMHRPSAEEIDVESALQKLRSRRTSAPPLSFARLQSARQPAAWWRRPGLAAAAAVAAIAGGALLWQMQHAEQPVATTEASARTYATTVGGQDTVRLSDGSMVVLGPASELSVPASYGVAVREVDLSGVGYFDVVHDETRPFAVRTSTAVVRDLGTIFTVRADAVDRVVVAVSSGSVQLRSRADSASTVVLNAGDRGVFGTATGIKAERAVPTDDDFAWTRGRLVFREAPLAEVSASLQRWYGVTLTSDDPSLAGRHITASFEREGVEQVLRIISVALGATVERRGSTAILRPIQGGPMVQ